MSSTMQMYHRSTLRHNLCIRQWKDADRAIGKPVQKDKTWTVGSCPVEWSSRDKANHPHIISSMHMHTQVYADACSLCHSSLHAIRSCQIHLPQAVLGAALVESGNPDDNGKRVFDLRHHHLHSWSQLCH